jgi:hypothetical protein
VASFTATSLACRIGRIERFPRSHSLANYWGLTPGCRNSGENDQRLGRITKAGSTMARWLLAQVTHKVLRKDARLREWFKRIKRRRGSKIARVAVMRKLATIMWMMDSYCTYCHIGFTQRAPPLAMLSSVLSPNFRSCQLGRVGLVARFVVA